VLTPESGDTVIALMVFMLLLALFVLDERAA
jgi:hypothetical protein